MTRLSCVAWSNTILIKHNKMSETKKIDWKTYESITAFIYKNLGRQAGVKIKGHGKQISFYDYVTDFCLHVADQNRMGIEITRNYEFPESQLFRRGISNGILVDAIAITGKLIQHDESKNLEFRLVDNVWLIMKSIFDNRKF